MDYYFWELDEPGNRHGVVLAYNETEARQKVYLWLEDMNRDLDSIVITWLSSDATDVFEIEL